MTTCSDAWEHGVPCIVCGAPAQWATCTPDDANVDHPTNACDAHLPDVLRRQYHGDVLVCLIAEGEAVEGEGRNSHE